MKNIDKYRDNIIKVLKNESYGFGYNPKTDRILNCLNDSACDRCLFADKSKKYSDGFCEYKRFLWLSYDDDKSIEQ